MSSPSSEELDERGADQLADGGYIQFSIPGYAYTVIRVPLKPGADPFIAAKHLQRRLDVVFEKELKSEREKEAARDAARNAPRGGGGGRRPPADPNAPKCPTHQAAYMKRNRANNGWYCPAKDEDQPRGYCVRTVDDGDANTKQQAAMR